MEAKISFGFKKLPKKSAVIGAKPPDEKKVELIECLDASNIKIIGHVEEEKKELVIPLQGANKNLLDRIKEANDLKERSRIKYRSNGITFGKKTKEKEEVKDMRPDSELTIEELAARKLIEEAKINKRKITAATITTIATQDQLILEGAKEPTMDDYESVPISDFGMAMLRGMGWKEPQNYEKKNVKAPQLRPKGMGLGASVPGNTRNKIPLDKNGKELKLVKDAKARIIAGKEKDNYCIVQGLDDDAGRVIVKTTLAGTILTLNEFMLLPVSEEEYGKMAKVLNNAKFEKYSQKSPQSLETERKVGKDDNDVEYVPNSSNIKIELSSESEVEKKKHMSQNKIKVKEERRSRSNSNNCYRSTSPVKSKSHRGSRSYDRNKEVSRHRSRSCSRDRITLKSNRHLSRRESTRSRTKSRSCSLSRERINKRRDRLSRSKNCIKDQKSTNKCSRRHKYLESDSDSSSEDDNRQKRREKKSKKSRKHKRQKDKKMKKEKKKSKRRDSSYSSTSISDSGDNKKLSRGGSKK